MVTDDIKLRAMPWYLAHSVLNAMFSLWTFGGSVFVLFLAELGLPKERIGALLSLFPFCGLLALGFAPVAARWGRKRTYVVLYGLRKFVMAGLLVVPWMAGRYGADAALVYLAGLIIVFAVLRSLAETAFYPWSQEFIPNGVRGRLSAWAMVASLVATGVALGVAGQVLSAGTGMGRYLVLIGAGSALGVVGVAVMVKVPGGAPRAESIALGAHLANLREALRDANFRAYLGGVSAYTIGCGWFTFLPLFIREQVGWSAAAVVRLDILVAVGGAVACLGLGWVSDRVGSRPVLMTTAALLAVVPLGWLGLPREGAVTLAGCVVLYLLYGVGLNGVGISGGRLMNNGVVPPEKSTAYLAIYYAVMGVTGGLAPLLAGWLLSRNLGAGYAIGWIRLDVYTLFFVISLLVFGAAWWGFGKVRPDDRYTTRGVWRALLKRRG